MKRKGLKGFLHKFFKIFLILIVIGIVINAVIISAILINHRNKLKNERGYLVPEGEMVSVNGHDMHVLMDGKEDAEYTLVFMHSSGIVDDSVALEPLFNELSDYRLAYVERSGYGYSENSGSPRDIENMLNETRAALELAGASKPYVLVPVGTAGVEAVYWADKYPDEVAGIVGINMNYPEEYRNITQEAYCGFFNYVLVKFSGIGGHRLIKSIYPENDGALYTEKQMYIRKALISKGFYTEDMYQEDLAMVDNAAMTNALGWPRDTRMLLIYANPMMEPYFSEDSSVQEEYNEAVKESGKTDFDYEKAYNQEKREYFQAHENVSVTEMSGPSRLYTYNPKELAEIIAEYINGELSK